eukprot:10180380-Alexandrium_andersonii.AAC.1
MYDAGIVLYLSYTGVYLTEGFNGHIPPRFINRIERIEDGATLYPKGEYTVDPATLNVEEDSETSGDEPSGPSVRRGEQPKAGTGAEDKCHPSGKEET